MRRMQVLPTRHAAIQTDVVLFCFIQTMKSQKHYFMVLIAANASRLWNERKEKTQKFKSCTEEPKPNGVAIDQPRNAEKNIVVCFMYTIKSWWLFLPWE